MRRKHQGDGRFGSGGVPSGDTPGAEGGGDGGCAGLTQERHGEGTAGGHDLGRGATADLRAVLIEGHVADVVQSVLDAPVPTHQGQEGRGVGPLRWQTGDEVGYVGGVAWY